MESACGIGSTGGGGREWGGVWCDGGVKVGVGGRGGARVGPWEQPVATRRALPQLATREGTRAPF